MFTWKDTRPASRPPDPQLSVISLFQDLSFLFWDWFRTVLVYSLYGAVASAIFRIITELVVFVVQG